MIARIVSNLSWVTTVDDGTTSLRIHIIHCHMYLVNISRLITIQIDSLWSVRVAMLRSDSEISVRLYIIHIDK